MDTGALARRVWDGAVVAAYHARLAATAPAVPSAGKRPLQQLDLYMVESGGDRFRLDPRHRLASFRATHFGLPPDWHLTIDRPPDLWFGRVTVLMLTALQRICRRPSGVAAQSERAAGWSDGSRLLDQGGKAMRCAALRCRACHAMPCLACGSRPGFGCAPDRWTLDPL